MDDKETHIPLFVSVVTFFLGSFDILRGLMHTVELQYSALHIAKLDLSTPEATDLLHLLGAFGISNFITGTMLILLAVQARGLALVMLLVIPISYTIGMVEIHANSLSYAPSKAAWEGFIPMMVYLGICVVTFLLGLVVTLYNKSNES